MKAPPAGTKTRNCDGGLCRYCENDAAVSLNGNWVCLEHFRSGLIQASKQMQSLAAVVRGEVK